MTTDQWRLERAIRALELASTFIANRVKHCNKSECPVALSVDCIKRGCATTIAKHFLRKTRGLKK